MLFGACNCAPGSSLLSTLGPLCAGGAGFVSAVVGAMVANARTAPARPLGRPAPEVDRLAVRMVTDNVVIQFIPSQTRDGITIERRSGGNTTPDAPPRAALNGEWGLSMHAQSHRGEEVRNVLVDFGYTPEVLLNNLSILKIDPASFDFGLTRDLGYELARGEIVLNLSQDVVPKPGWLAALVACLADPGVAYASARCEASAVIAEGGSPSGATCAASAGKKRRSAKNCAASRRVRPARSSCSASACAISSRPRSSDRSDG